MKQSSLDSYRKSHPKPPRKLRDGLLAGGNRREVIVEDMDEPAVAECYTMREAAEALGRTMLSLKRWIKVGLVPPPVLRDTTHNYLQYSRGELSVICRELDIHERSFSLYSTKHEATTHRIWQAMQAYRSMHI